MTTPLVTVGLPVFNGEKHIGLAIDSILSQDFRDFELLVQDNASTDGTQAIVENFCRGDPRIDYKRESTNKGAISSFNKLIERARGEFFMWASDHDFRHPSSLDITVEALQANPEAVLAYTHRIEVDESGTELGVVADHIDTRGVAKRYRPAKIVKDGGLFTCVYGLFRTSALRQVGGMRVTYGPDVCLLAELSLTGPFVEVSQPLLHYRIFDEARPSGTPGHRLATKTYLNKLDPGYGDRWIPSHFPYLAMTTVVMKRVGIRLSPGERPRCLSRLGWACLNRWNASIAIDLGLAAPMRIVGSLVKTSRRLIGVSRRTR